MPSIFDTYPHKLAPLKWQRETFEETAERRMFALLAEQGTGKTKPAVDTASWLCRYGKIDGGLILAPPSVHRNWVTDELPKHLPDKIAARSRMHVYESAYAATKWHQSEVKDVIAHEGMAWLAMSYHAFMTKRGRKVARRFLTRRHAIMFADEAHHIRQGSKRAMAVVAEGRYAPYRRIMSGTLVANGPMDIFAPFRFLDEDFWKKRGMHDFTSFKARFVVFKTIVLGNRDDEDVVYSPSGAVQLGWDNAQVLEDYRRAFEAGTATADDEPELEGPEDLAPEPPQPEQAAQVRGGARTREIPVGVKNLDELHELIKPHSVRVLKTQVLDLPPKLYTKRHFLLSKEQRRVYNALRDEYMAELNGELVTAEMAIVRLLRLQQITCGYLPSDDLERLHLFDENPRMDAALETIGDSTGQGIICARFTQDIDQICKRMRETGRKAFRIDGTVSERDRQRAKEAFKAGDGDLVVNPAAMSEGHTLTEAQWMLMYSNSFKLIERLQVEDRPHRIGQTRAVLYTDLLAEDTVDHGIVESMRRKWCIASQINGDVLRSWI